MRHSWVLSIALTVAASADLVPGQHVGAQDFSWTNTAAGTPVLAARVHYPADVSGIGVPMTANPDGYPVVVFLHGYGLQGNDYHPVGDHLAREGFIAVMLNTAIFSYTDMEDDARAMFGTLVAANAEPGGFFEGAIQVDRIGLLGHSMGGAVLAYVLHEDPAQGRVNPGYVCGLGIAPVDPALAFSGIAVHVPLGLVSGQGDTLTPPFAHASPYYASLDTVQGLKFHYQMGLAAGHLNLVGLSLDEPTVFDRSRAIMSGFFGQFLGDNLIGLETVLGPNGQSDPNLVLLEMDAAVPQTWADSPLHVGKQTRISVAVEDGFAGLLAAASTASVPTTTSLGQFLLDPLTAFTVTESIIVGERLDVMISVPLVSALAGSTFAVQGAGPTINEPFKLGSAISFVIEL